MAATTTHFALLFLAISPEVVTASLTTGFTSIDEELCFSNAHTRFEPIKENVKRIICPMLSTMINEGVLPMKKFYTQAELRQMIIEAGLPETGEGENANVHAEAVFMFNSPKVMDIFNMEGNPNEHNASTGINDCESIYPCDMGVTHVPPLTQCGHQPVVIGRTTPFPIPVPNLHILATRVLPAQQNKLYELFAPDIVDHLPKSLQTSRCNCVVPDEGRFNSFVQVSDLNKDGIMTRAEIRTLQGEFVAHAGHPDFPIVSRDLNPVGFFGGDVAGAYELLAEVFARTQPQVDPDHHAFTTAQLRSVLLDRMFPSTFTFTGQRCFNDPNEALNQNDYSSVASTSKTWTLTEAVPFPIASQSQCKDRAVGLSQLTGEIFFGTGTISTTLRGGVQGGGEGYLDFGNCGSQGGSVSVTLGGTIIKTAMNPSTLVQFNFTEGQILQLSAANGGVIRLNFIALNGPTACGPCGPAPTRLNEKGPAVTVGLPALSMFAFFVIGGLVVASVVVAYKRRTRSSYLNVAVEIEDAAPLVE